MKPDFSYKLTKKVLNNINSYELIRHGDCVIAGLSGGADSVCLILLLKEIKKYIDYDLHAVHVNHGIRGDEAAYDENFSRKLCEKLDIPFKSYKVDVPALSDEKGMTLEEAGRNARYGCFKSYADELPEADNMSVKVALAHHIDDQAETVIFNMIRGSGLKGMGGIDIKSALGSLTVIRPLLSISKEDILHYLDFVKQDFCTDNTNFINDYSRNIIRNEAIPVLNRIQSQSSMHISKTAEELREAEAYIHKMMLKLFDDAVKCDESGKYVIDVKKVKDEEPVLVRYLIIHIIKQLVDTYKDITRTHIEDIYSLINKGKGKQIMLPFELTAKRIKNGIEIYRS